MGIKSVFYVCMVLLLFFAVAGLAEEIPGENGASIPDTPAISSDNGTVLAVYIIGSNLEFDSKHPEMGGAATQDITEMVRGYGNESESLQVLIGFGGSVKPGWNGITYMTMDQVREDLADGMIGNGQSNVFRDETGDMSDPATLSAFLTYVKTNYPGKRVIVVFWDHGNAWKGYGIDDNFQNPDSHDYHMLSPDDIGSALNQSGLYYDLIGFDACLMANLDVALSLAPYGNILVASEELEPGFGWDWVSLVKALKANPDISAEELGKTIVDSYMDNPAHTDMGKTLSVINLSAAPELSEKFDLFSEQLSGELTDEEQFKAIASAMNRIKPFGAYVIKSGETLETTVDLQDYLSSIGKYNPAKQKELEPVLKSLNETVMYKREDGSRPYSNGLSIYSPYTAILASENKAERPEKRKAGFELFLDKFVESAKSSNLAPEIIEDRGGYTITDNESYTIQLTFLEMRNDSMVVLGTEPAYPDKPGHYPFPTWGGWGLQWQNKDLNEGLAVPVKFVGYTSTGKERYEAWGSVTRGESTQDIKFDFYYHPKSGDIEYYVIPYHSNGGTTIYDKQVYSFAPGDILSMWALYKQEGGGERYDDYGSITWTDETTLGYAMLPCGNYTVMFDVMNVARKDVYQDYKDIEIPCANSSLVENRTESP